MNLALFYHVYPGDGWEEMYQEQLGALLTSNLYEQLSHFHIGFNGSLDLLAVPERAVAVENQNKQEETNTLEALRDWCKENPSGYALYIHTKGSSRKTKYTEDWRRVMQFFCVHNWKQCVEDLESGYETAGINWQEDTSMGYWPHYSGGFWWAKASYVAVNCEDSYLSDPLRFMREFWIGSGKPKAKNYWETNMNLKDKAYHYTQPYGRNIYSKDYLNGVAMDQPHWKEPNEKMARMLVDLNINGFEYSGGTDKNTIHNFTGIYAYLLDQYRDMSSCKLLEIGIQHGGSALLWHEWLPKVQMTLVDIQDIVPDVIWDQLDPDRYDFYQMDAYTKTGIETLGVETYDIIIDDGPHTLDSQKFSLMHYSKFLNPGGVLIIEDIQSPSHLDQLSDCVPEMFKDGIRVFDVRETRNRYDDLIFAIVREE